MGTAPDARVALLSRLIDHAPLFPPASLPLEGALAEHARARASDAAFMLGRFVCPASRLGELGDVGRGVSVVLDRTVAVDSVADDVRVEALETRLAGNVAALAGLAAHARPGTELYVEIELDDDLEPALDTLVEAGLRAKVRCGGASTPTAFGLARFLGGCAERGLPFKATAGLHHAVRRDGEHGFLNLLAAVVFGDDEEALAEADPDTFHLDAESFHWRDRSAGPGELARARRERLHSIGSCSFFEPVAELEQMGILPL